MTWNHRVIRHVDQHGEIEDIWFGVHEVFYTGDNDDLEGASWTEDAIKIIEGSPGDLLKTIQRIRDSVEKPILMIDGNSLKEWKP